MQDELTQFEALFRENYQRLCNRVNRIVADMDTAEDIVQEVFVRFWEYPGRQSVVNPEAYLYKAAINKAISNSSDHKRRTTLAAQYQQEQPEVATAGQDLELQELQNKVQQAIAALPPACRKVFLLSRYEEMSHKEIADFLSISTNTVDNHIKKALAILRQMLLSLLLALFQIYLNYFS